MGAGERWGGGAGGWYRCAAAAPAARRRPSQLQRRSSAAHCADVTYAHLEVAAAHSCQRGIDVGVCGVPERGAARVDCLAYSVAVAARRQTATALQHHGAVAYSPYRPTATGLQPYSAVSAPHSPASRHPLYRGR